MANKKLLFGLSLLIVIAGCTRITRPVEKIPFYVEQAGFHRGLWVRAVSIASPDSIPKILHIAQKLGITDMYVQVVVGGYAYYHSSILPRSQYLSKVSGAEYDPLDVLIRAAQKRSIRIRVHAWVNALLVWSLKEPPDSLRHIFYTHPEWFIKDINGISMVNYSHKEWTDAGLEGLYLNPAHKEAQEHLKRVCREIVTKYQVSGIHLDFIRYPGPLWGLPENDEAAIFAGVEGYSVRWLNLVRYPQLPFLLRWTVWHYWKINQQKEMIIAQVVKETHSQVSDSAKQSDCVLTTAVFANPSMARYRFAQNWMNWGQSLDYPVVMSYTQDIGLFSDFIHFAQIHRPDAVFGIGFLWTDMEAEAYWQVKAVRQSRGKGISFFDFASIDTMVDFEKLKKAHTIPEGSLFQDTTRYEQVTDVFIDLPKKDFVEGGKNLRALGEDFTFSEFILSLSLNQSQDLMRMDLSREDFLKQVQEDVAAFEYLDSHVFPLADTLIEPPKREVYYEFVPWTEEDSALVIAKAMKIKHLTQHTLVYPSAVDALARAAFNTEMDKRELCETKTGIYVFEVRKIFKGGKKVGRSTVEPQLLPAYLNWTIREKIKVLSK